MENIAPALLAWFYQNRRSLPFRDDPTPYHVWVSEIMLQQTRVAAALPYYERFVRELPDIPALAACPPERLDKLWEGLGYYRRVHSMQKAAQLVCRQYGGLLPASYDALLALPGIGPYTAGAIASIGFGLAVPAVDGNVLRVFARLYNDGGSITEPAVKKRFTARVMEQIQAEAAPARRPAPRWNRAGWRNLAGLAACAVLCLGLWHGAGLGSRENVVDGPSAASQSAGQEDVSSRGLPVKVLNLALPDDYIEHGSVDVLRREVLLDAESMTKRIITEYIGDRS